jgi:hypothetical protein
MTNNPTSWICQLTFQNLISRQPIIIQEAVSTESVNSCCFIRRPNSRLSHSGRHLLTENVFSTLSIETFTRLALYTYFSPCFFALTTDKRQQQRRQQKQLSQHIVQTTLQRDSSKSSPTGNKKIAYEDKAKRSQRYKSLRHGPQD